MSRECNKLYNRLADLISGKRKENYAVICTWIHRKLCFALTLSVPMSVMPDMTPTSLAVAVAGKIQAKSLKMTCF